MRAILIWAALAIAFIVPVALSATSPLLAWRDPLYIAAGFAGIVALGLLLFQPLLAAGLLPALSARAARRAHVWTGAGLVVAVVAHIAGLWITSPPDVIDVLLFRSPTPFAIWGVLAMWAVFAAAALAALRRKLHMRPAIWRGIHTGLAGVIVIGSTLHAILIEGTMETASKAVLCIMVIVVIVRAVLNLRGQRLRRKRGA